MSKIATVLSAIALVASAQAAASAAAAQDASDGVATFAFADGRTAQARAVSAAHYTLEVDGWDVPATHIGAPLALASADIDLDGRDDLLVLVDRDGPRGAGVVDVYDLDGEGPVLMFVTRGGHDEEPDAFVAQTRSDYAVRMNPTHLREASTALRALDTYDAEAANEAARGMQRAFWIDEIEAGALADLLSAERAQFDALDDMRAVRRSLLHLEYLRSARAQLQRRQAARFAEHAAALRAAEDFARSEN